MSERLKKAAIAVSIAAGVLIVAACVFGVLNGLIANGEWSFGWSDYHYDETGYSIGSGTVAVDRLTAVDLDWVDGTVSILPCEDTYPSLTEMAKDELPESAYLRWRVDKDGTLRIRYRKSSWTFGIGADRQKDLILRIPKSFFENLEELNIHTKSTKVKVDDISCKQFLYESGMGELETENCSFASVTANTKNGKISLGASVTGEVSITANQGSVEYKTPVLPQGLSVTTKRGDVVLGFFKDAVFCVEWNGKKGTLTSDFLYAKQENLYAIGEGGPRFTVTSESGDLLLTTLDE